MQHADKRHHQRVRIEMPLRYREVGAAPPVFKGVLVRDLSEGGVRFQSEKFIPRNASIMLEFHIASNPRPLRARSRVVWSRELSLGNRYEVGSEFSDMIPLEKEILGAYLAARA